MSGFLLGTRFFARGEFFYVEIPFFLGFFDSSPFSELGFSLTLTPWSTQSGTFTCRRLTSVLKPEVALMKKAPQ